MYRPFLRLHCLSSYTLLQARVLGYIVSSRFRPLFSVQILVSHVFSGVASESKKALKNRESFLLLTLLNPQLSY